MRKIILSLAVSLDGFIEDSAGNFDWCFTDQDYGMTAFFQRIDSLFIGRKSYELVQSMGDSAMAGFPQLKEYVFSTTLNHVKPGAVLIKNNLLQEVKKIKDEPGKDIWLFGGASLITSLMNLQLVDEISLAIHPVILGGGKPVFQDIKGRVPLTLKNTEKYDSGLVSVLYDVQKKVE